MYDRLMTKATKTIGASLTKPLFNLKYQPNRVDILAEDWGLLIVLDACRYDMFEELNTIDGSLSKRISKAPNTKLWLQSNFANRDLSGITYITANPMYRKAKGSYDFTKIVDMWTHKWRNDTVWPTDMVDEIGKQFNQRIICHLIQPHLPFISDYAKSHGLNSPNIWGELRDGNVSFEEVKQAYYANLQLALDALEPTIYHYDNVVITSDHGNCYGRKFLWGELYGHPPLHVPELVTIPWLEVDHEG